MKILLLPIAISVVLISYGWSQDANDRKVLPSTSEADSSSYENTNIEEILDQSEDSERVRLSGSITKKLQCSTYLFKDETGEIRVQIDDNHIPEKGLLFNAPMSIKGEIEPASNGKPVRIDADKVRYFF